MDTKLIQQYGEDILCYRIRTARQKKRMQYEDFDKQLIQLDKYQTQLYEQHRQLGWEPLLPPVQKGWIRHFVLREDVARNKHADFFENILKKINSFHYSWRKDFKKKKRRRGRKIYVVRPQRLLKLDEWNFNRLKFTETEKQFFHELWETDTKRQLVKRYVFKQEWRFVLKVRPNIIDKVRQRDTGLESEMRLVGNYIEKNDLKGRQAKLLHGSLEKWNTNKYFEKYNEANPFKNKSLIQILDILKHN